MSNNKQSSVEWYIIERHIMEIQSRLGLISPIEYDAKLIKIEEQAKAMHKEEKKQVLKDYFAWHKSKGFVSHKPEDIDEYCSTIKEGVKAEGGKNDQ